MTIDSQTIRHAATLANLDFDGEEERVTAFLEILQLIENNQPTTSLESVMIEDRRLGQEESTLIPGGLRPTALGRIWDAIPDAEKPPILPQYPERVVDTIINWIRNAVIVIKQLEIQKAKLRETPTP